MSLVDHNIPELYQKIDSMSSKELDALPLGTIQLDRDGEILQYNASEEKLAHTTKAKVIGKNFFTEVAPCTDVQAFRGRFLEGVRKKDLHETFRYHFSFKINPVDVSVTLYYSGRTDTVWVFVRKLEE
jgi:photoactive yellow protein